MWRTATWCVPCTASASTAPPAPAAWTSPHRCVCTRCARRKPAWKWACPPPSCACSAGVYGAGARSPARHRLNGPPPGARMGRLRIRVGAGDVADIRSMYQRHLPLLALAAVMALSAPVTAQKKLTNQAIWTSRAFTPEMVGGLASMNDGEHYTVVERDGDAVVLARYAYRTGARVDILVRQDELTLPGRD